VGLVGPVAQLLVHEQSLFAEVDGLSVVSQAAVVHAQVGERDGLADLVAQLLEEVVGAARGVERVGRPALEGVHEVAVVVRPGLTGEIVMRSFQRGVEMAVGVVEAAEIGQRKGQVAVRASLFHRVAEPFCGGHGGPLRLGPVVPVAPPVQEDEQRQRQMADVPVEAKAGREFERGEKGRPLGGEPCRRLVGSGERDRGHAG
jgi:hypothetical protein